MFYYCKSLLMLMTTTIVVVVVVMITDRTFFVLKKYSPVRCLSPWDPLETIYKSIPGKRNLTGCPNKYQAGCHHLRKILEENRDP